MKQVQINVYSYEELNEEAQRKAIEELTPEYFEAEYTIEDAKNVFINIHSYDIERFCQGEFMEDAIKTAHTIIAEHGDTCETYKTAETFLKERDEIVDTWEKDENGDFINVEEMDEKLDEIETDFLQSILEDYRILLKNDYEYQFSDEAIIETIQENEYEFTEEGKLFHQ